MLKTLILFLTILLMPLLIFANIVNNSGSAAADSISIPFFALDSAGNIVALTTNDSLYLVTFYPNGSVAFRDTVAFNNALIDTVHFSGDIYYNWNLAVSAIDGSGKNGVYSYMLAVHDNTSAALTTPHRGTFQLYQTVDYNTGIDSMLAAIARLDGQDASLTNIIDSLYAIIDSIQNQSTWVATSANQTLIIDTVNGIVDTVQNQSTWGATSAKQDLITDTVYAIIDTTQNQDDWIGTLANQTLLIDSLYAVIDSLQSQDGWVAKEASLYDGDKTGFRLSTTGIDDFFDEILAGHTVDGSFGEIVLDSLDGKISDISGGTGLDSATTSRILHRVVWGTSKTAGADSSTIAERDATAGSATVSDATISLIADTLDLRGLYDSLFAVLDSIQNQDDWVATAATLANVVDSVNAIIDSLQNQDDWIASTTQLTLVVDTVNGIIDTLQLQDDWIAKASELTNAIDSLNAIIDSLQSQSTWGAKESSLFDGALNLDNATGTLSDAQIDNVTVIAGTVSDKTGYTVSTVSDKTGYTVSTVSDKTGYSLSAGGVDAIFDEDTTGHNTANSYGVALTDTSAYQGSASGLTVQAIVDGVLDEPQSSHTTAGTIGKYIDTEISGVSSPAGDGAYTVTMVLIDTTATPDTTVRNAPLYINNEAQSSTPNYQLTDNNGEASFNLDAGDWVMFTTMPGYSNTVDSFTISGAVTDTLMVYQTTGDRTTVAFDLRTNDGSFLASAKVRMELLSENDSLLYYGDLIIHTPWVVQDTANSSGLVEIPLYPNSLFTNDSTYYKVTIYDQKKKRPPIKFSMRVPVSDSVVHFQLLPRWIEEH